MTIKFGTDGWRALIAKEFTFENVERVAQAYADLIKEKNQQTPLPLGFDRRFLSEDFAKTVACVLAANGIPTLLAKTFCPTPAISWMTKHTESVGGIMITASHNPYLWNGIKFKEAPGGSASPEFTSRIEKRILEREAASLKPLSMPFEEATKKFVRFFDPHEAYVEQLKNFIDLKAIQNAEWDIAYDPLYGAGSGYLEKVLGQKVAQIHDEENPCFGRINPEPIGSNLGELMLLVKEKKFDVGLATDGDADRIGAVDENGNFVNSHQIFSLILSYLVEKGLRGDVIKTVSTTQMINLIAAAQGITVHETPIGFKHICGKFLQIPCLMGGEESGGIGIPTHVLERDGLLSGLLLLEMMSVKKKRLGELLAELTKKVGDFHFERQDLHVSEEVFQKLRTTNLKDLKTIGSFPVTEVSDKDGVKFFFEDHSWLLIRVSGTEPLVRIYAESQNPERVKQLLTEAKNLVF